MRDTTKCQGSNPLKVTEPSGYIASVVTKETSCGSEVSPWVIEGKPGQRVNLTLFDFGPLTDNSHTDTEYFTLRDEVGLLERNMIFSGGDRREVNVYTSLSNVLEVKVNSSDNYHFLLKYEGMFTRTTQYCIMIKLYLLSYGIIVHLVTQ